MSSSTMRMRLASGGDDKGPDLSGERAQEVGRRNDADDVAALQHGKRADRVVDHDPGCLSHVAIRIDDDHARGHHLGQRQTRQQVADLPDGETRRRRRHVRTDIAVGYDAQEYPVLVGDEKVPDPTPRHLETSVGDRGRRGHREDFTRHHVTYALARAQRRAPLVVAGTRCARPSGGSTPAPPARSRRIGVLVPRSTDSATLPMMSRLIPPRAWLVMTMRSTSCAEA